LRSQATRRLLLAALVIVAVVILGFLLLGRPPDVGANVRAWQEPELAPALISRLGIGNATDLSISPDGKTVAVSTGIGVFSYRFDTLEPVWASNTEYVPAILGWSDAGHLLVTGSSERRLTIRDTETGQDVATLQGDYPRLSSISLSPDGLTVAGGSYTPEGIWLWDAHTGEQRARLPGDGIFGVETLAWSPDSSQLASGWQAGNLIIWNVTSREELRRLEGHTGSVRELAYSPDGAWLASASWDSTGFIWNMQTGERVRQFAKVWVGALAWSPDGQVLGYGSSPSDARITLEDAFTGGEQVVLTRRGTGVMDSPVDLVWSPDGRTLIGATTNEPVVIWDAQTGRQVRSLGGHEGQVQDVSWSPDGDQLAAATDGGMVVLWNPKTTKEQQGFEETSGRAFVVAWSPDGRRLAAGGAGSVTVWDVQRAETLRAFTPEGGIVEGEGPRVDAIAWSPDGGRLAARAGTGTVEVWDIATGERLLREESPGPNRTGLAWSLDGEILAADAWLNGNVISFWDSQTGELLDRLAGARYAERSPIDDSLASVIGEYGRHEDNLILWDPGTGEPRCVTETRDTQHTLAWSPDGSLVVGTGSSGDLAVWDARDCRRIHRWSVHQDFVSQAEWSPDGDVIASSSWDGTVKLWGIEPIAPTAQPFATSTGAPSPTAAPMLTPNTTSAVLPQVSFPGEPPAWLSDPAVDVLAVAIGNEPVCSGADAVQLSFMNAETGEVLELTTPPARAMMWLDSQTFGLLSLDGETILSVDLADGSLGTTSFDAEGIRLLSGKEPFRPEEFGCTMRALELVRGSPAGEGRVVLGGPPSDYSADLSLLAELGTDKYDDLDPFDALEVRKVGTGELAWSADPDDEYDATFEHEFAWSPVEPGRLAVVECGIGELDRCVRQRLYVVDVGSGEELGSYPGEFMNIVWSPDGRKLLYTSPEWERWRPDARYPPESGPPCVLDLGDGASECFDDEVSVHFPDELFIQDKEVLGLWDRRGDGFSYVYRGVGIDPDDFGGTPGDYIALGGLCHLDLTTRRADCPSEDLPELQGVWLGGVELSASEEFAYLQFSWEDVVGHGVLDLRRRQFYPLPLPPGSTNLDALDAVDLLWRPLSPIESPVAVQASLPTEQLLGETPSIWDAFRLSEGLDLPEPGTRQFSVDVNPSDTFVWPFYWCASDEETLADNLLSITVDFTIDGVVVPATNLLEYNTHSQEWDCHFWATMLSGWERGSETLLIVRYSFSQDVDDGVQEYLAGDYSYELNVKVGK